MNKLYMSQIDKIWEFISLHGKIHLNKATYNNSDINNGKPVLEAILYYTMGKYGVCKDLADLLNIAISNMQTSITQIIELKTCGIALGVERNVYNSEKLAKVECTVANKTDKGQETILKYCASASENGIKINIDSKTHSADELLNLIKE